MKRRIYALDAAIKELRGASGSWITWTDQEGGHTRPWYELEHILYAAQGPRGESPAVCPILSLDMDQLKRLPPAQQLHMGLALERAGFPALEMVRHPDGRECWENRTGMAKCPDRP